MQLVKIFIIKRGVIMESISKQQAQLAFIQSSTAKKAGGPKRRTPSRLSSPRVKPSDKGSRSILMMLLLLGLAATASSMEEKPESMGTLLLAGLDLEHEKSDIVPRKLASVTDLNCTGVATKEYSPWEQYGYIGQTFDHSLATANNIPMLSSTTLFMRDGDVWSTDTHPFSLAGDLSSVKAEFGEVDHGRHFEVAIQRCGLTIGDVRHLSVPIYRLPSLDLSRILVNENGKTLQHFTVNNFDAIRSEDDFKMAFAFISGQFRTYTILRTGLEDVGMYTGNGNVRLFDNSTFVQTYPSLENARVIRASENWDSLTPLDTISGFPGVPEGVGANPPFIYVTGPGFISRAKFHNGTVGPILSQFFDASFRNIEFSHDYAFATAYEKGIWRFSVDSLGELTYLDRISDESKDLSIFGNYLFSAGGTSGRISIYDIASFSRASAFAFSGQTVFNIQALNSMVQLELGSNERVFLNVANIFQPQEFFRIPSLNVNEMESYFLFLQNGNALEIKKESVRTTRIWDVRSEFEVSNAAPVTVDYQSVTGALFSQLFTFDLIESSPTPITTASGTPLPVISSSVSASPSNLASIDPSEAPSELPSKYPAPSAVSSPEISRIPVSATPKPGPSVSGSPKSEVTMPSIAASPSSSLAPSTSPVVIGSSDSTLLWIAVALGGTAIVCFGGVILFLSRKGVIVCCNNTGNVCFNQANIETVDVMPAAPEALRSVSAQVGTPSSTRSTPIAKNKVEMV